MSSHAKVTCDKSKNNKSNLFISETEQGDEEQMTVIFVGYRPE